MFWSQLGTRGRACRSVRCASALRPSAPSFARCFGGSWDKRSRLQEHALRISLAPVGAQQHAPRQVRPVVCDAQQTASAWPGMF